MKLGMSVYHFFGVHIGLSDYQMGRFILLLSSLFTTTEYYIILSNTLLPIQRVYI